MIRYTLPTASAHSANLLLAADTTLERTAPPPLRAYARYLGVGQLLVRRDQRWQPWHGAPPAEVDAQVRGSDGRPAGRDVRSPGREHRWLTAAAVFDIVRGGRLMSAAPASGQVLIAGDGFAGRAGSASACWTASCRSDILADLDTPGLKAAIEAVGGWS